MSGCYGDSCDVLRFNEVCKHCREVQPAGSRLFDERQADRCYHHADVASASIPDDASRACLRIDGIEDRPRIFPKTLLFQGRTSFIPTCCRSLPPFALNTLSLKQGNSVTGRRGCGRLSLNKHGLECEQQQSKEKLYVSSWTDVPCARRILDRRYASSRSSKFTTLAPTSCMKCRAWRLGGLTVLVASAVRLRSVGDGIVGAFFLLRARWVSAVAPKLLYGCLSFPRAYRDRELASAQMVGSRRCAPSSACLFTIGEEWALRWLSLAAPLAKRRRVHRQA